jgi:hypothetical protein
MIFFIFSLRFLCVFFLIHTCTIIFFILGSNKDTTKKRLMSRIFNILRSFSQSEVKEFKKHFDRIYEQKVASIPPVSSVSGSGSKVKSHSRAYHELVVCMDETDYIDQVDVNAWMSFGELPSGSSVSQGFSQILVHARKMKKGGDRLELICSVSVVAHLYKMEFEACRKDGASLNLAKSAAREFVKTQVPEFCLGSDFYLVKKLAALEFLYTLSRDNMDILLLKKMTYKRLMALSAYDKKTLLENSRYDCRSWEQLDSDFRAIFE